MCCVSTFCYVEHGTSLYSAGICPRAPTILSQTGQKLQERNEKSTTTPPYSICLHSLRALPREDQVMFPNEVPELVPTAEEERIVVRER